MTVTLVLASIGTAAEVGSIAEPKLIVPPETVHELVKVAETAMLPVAVAAWPEVPASRSPEARAMAATMRLWVRFMVGDLGGWLDFFRWTEFSASTP